MSSNRPAQHRGGAAPRYSRLSQGTGRGAAIRAEELRQRLYALVQARGALAQADAVMHTGAPPFEVLGLFRELAAQGAIVLEGSDRRGFTARRLP